MPHCFVKQPNGNYAIWSTIVDDFLVLDCTREEALKYELSERNMMGYPGGIDALRNDLEKSFEHIEKSGIAWHWANDWNDCLRWCEKFNKGGDSLRIIDELGLPHRMKPTVSPLRSARYWVSYWVNRAECLEFELRRLIKQRSEQ